MSLRVALVCLPSTRGGVEQHVLDLARSIGGASEPTVVTAAGGWLADRATKAGLRVVSVPEPRGNGDIRALRALRESLRWMRPDIVHSHLARSDWYAWLATRGLGDVLLVSTEHGISADRPDVYGGVVRRTLHGLGHRLRLRDTAATVAVSQATARALSARYARLRDEPPSVVRPGIDTARFRDVRRTARRAGQPLAVAMIGRLAPEKGAEVLLRAAAICQGIGQPIRVTISGEGPLRVSLEALRDGLGLSDVVRFRGHVEDVSEVLGECDVLAVPSLAENLPLVILAALSAGVPVIASDVGGIREVVAHRVNGLVVPSSDDAALADALALLARDDTMLEGMSQAARASADGFSLSAAAQGILTVYERIA